MYIHVVFFPQIYEQSYAMHEDEVKGNISALSIMNWNAQTTEVHASNLIASYFYVK